MHEGMPIAVDLPASVVLTITDTAPGAKGDTKTGALEARDRRDGRGRQRAAVRRGGRADQGRYAVGRLRRAREGLSVTRREERRIAIDVLYQADITDASAAGGGRGLARGRSRGARRSPCELVEGVAERLPDIDLLLETHAEGWSVARMAALDRTILRVGVYELLWDDDVPPSVAISEAVEAAAELSADDAKRFVNGVLGRIAREEGSSSLGRSAGRPLPAGSARAPAAGGVAGGRRGGAPPGGAAAALLVHGAFLEALLELALRLAHVPRDLRQLRGAEDHHDADDEHDHPVLHVRSFRRGLLSG